MLGSKEVNKNFAVRHRLAADKQKILAVENF